MANEQEHPVAAFFSAGFGRWRFRPITLLAVISSLALSAANPARGASEPITTQPSPARAARAAVQSGMIVYRLTDPDELKHLLGHPVKETSKEEGEERILTLEFPGVQAVFTMSMQWQGSFVVRQIVIEGQEIDIGQNRMVVLRNEADLRKFDHISGVCGASLAKLDLRSQRGLLNVLPFDSRTLWPSADKLPDDFDPARLLEEGKNPGLGVRSLHRQGINGRGIHIAIIDQPLLREHVEYKDRVAEYVPINVDGAEPSLHGSPVTSIAVGRTCGTAPGASVHYYAVPAWKWWDEHCRPYAATLERIIQHNRDLPPVQKVRVVSVSLGAFSQWPDHELWAKAVRHAADEGILVVTCDPASTRLMMLKRKPAKDPDMPTSYSKQLFFAAKDALCVPAGNRTTASYTGPNDYIFWRDGGMSWTVPYLAGLSALACQVNPEIRPAAISDLWVKTATRTSAGLIVNPVAFVEAIRNANRTTKPVP